MDENVEFNNLEEALNRCGASWDAAQTHGLLTGRLAVVGVPAGPDWLLQVLEVPRMLVCVQQLWHIGAKDLCMAWFL